MQKQSLVKQQYLNQLNLTHKEQERRQKGKSSDGTKATCWTAVAEHLSSGWNLCDLARIIALYFAAVAHFIDSGLVLQQVGALGVLLNAFSFLQLLRRGVSRSDSPGSATPAGQATPSQLPSSERTSRHSLPRITTAPKARRGRSGCYRSYVRYVSISRGLVLISK